ncbi:MAG TPA: histidine kinase [Acidimicrobiales bacterium]|nr:histidine kinase [Acidimicrobiales bacterium]
MTSLHHLPTTAPDGAPGGALQGAPEGPPLPVTPTAPGREGSLYSAVRRLAHTHALATDAAGAGVLLGAALLWLAHAQALGPGAAVVTAALVVPLAWRRRWPSAVFAVVAVVALAQWIVGYRLVADGALLVALYTVAVHEPRLHTALATVVLEVGVVMAATRWSPAGTVPRSLVFLTATVVAAVSAGLTVRSGSRYMGWLAERARRLELERDQQAAIGAARERTRIARELHDIVAHSLAVVITLADAASLVAESDPARAAATMHRASDVGRQAMRDLRTMVGVLRTEDPGEELGPQPGVADIDALLERVRATGLEVELDVAGTPFPLEAATGLALYRILQEALTNTIKHASATSVRVTLRYRHPVVELVVADDGTGGEAGHGGGHGIEGMHERAGLHGGTVTAGPGARRGWEVTATLRSDPEAVQA